MRNERRLDCPNCRTRMNQRERNDVVIDYCPDCGGVWLDPGELEAITSASGHSSRRRHHSHHGTHHHGHGHGHGEEEEEGEEEEAQAEFGAEAEGEEEEEGGVLGMVESMLGGGEGEGEGEEEGGFGGFEGGGGDEEE